MRAPTPEQKQKTADLLGWAAEQRFEARRRQATRRRGMTRAGNRMSMDLGGSGHSTVTRHLPTPWLLIAGMGSLGALFLLAVIGVYLLIREVFGR